MVHCFSIVFYYKERRNGHTSISEEPRNSSKMSAYMKHQFVFAGIPAPERQALSKQLLKRKSYVLKEKLCQEIEAYYQKQNENISMSLLI